MYNFIEVGQEIEDILNKYNVSGEDMVRCSHAIMNAVMLFYIEDNNLTEINEETRAKVSKFIKVALEDLCNQLLESSYLMITKDKDHYRELLQKAVNKSPTKANEYNEQFLYYWKRMFDKQD